MCKADHVVQDAFFQPYLPLQQLDLLKDSQGWLCGSTNTIVTQQKEVELFINVGLQMPSKQLDAHLCFPDGDSHTRVSKS